MLMLPHPIFNLGSLPGGALRGISRGSTSNKFDNEYLANPLAFKYIEALNLDSFFDQ